MFDKLYSLDAVIGTVYSNTYWKLRQMENAKKGCARSLAMHCATRAESAAAEIAMIASTRPESMAYNEEKSAALRDVAETFRRDFDAIV